MSIGAGLVLAFTGLGLVTGSVEIGLKPGSTGADLFL